MIYILVSSHLFFQRIPKRQAERCLHVLMWWFILSKWFLPFNAVNEIDDVKTPSVTGCPSTSESFISPSNCCIWAWDIKWYFPRLDNCNSILTHLFLVLHLLQAKDICGSNIVEHSLDFCIASPCTISSSSGESTSALNVSGSITPKLELAIMQ